MASKRGPGRPSSLTPEVMKTIINEVVMGATYVDACVLAGVSVATFNSWRVKGEAQVRGEYREFLTALSEARVKRRKYYRADILSKSKEKKDWRGVAYVASVTEPAEFAQKVHVVVEQELVSALERLKREFANEPAVLQRALGAIAGESGAEAPAVAPGSGGTVAAPVGQGEEGSGVEDPLPDFNIDAARSHLAARLAASRKPPGS